MPNTSTRMCVVCRKRAPQQQLWRFRSFRFLQNPIYPGILITPPAAKAKLPCNPKQLVLGRSFYLCNQCFQNLVCKAHAPKPLILALTKSLSKLLETSPLKANQEKNPKK